MIKAIANAGLDFWAFIKSPEDKKDLTAKDGFKAKRLFSILTIGIANYAITHSGYFRT